MTQPADRRLLTEAAGNATYVPAGLSAAKRSRLSQIAVPRDSTGAVGNAAKLQWTGKPQTSSPREVGTDGAMYLVRLENTIWRTYDGMATWEVGPTIKPWGVGIYAGGGTYTLSAGGQTTAPIPYAAKAPEVKAALEALSSVGAGNVTVYDSNGGTTGGYGYGSGGDGFTILFQGPAKDHTLTGSHSLTANPAPVLSIAREGLLYCTRTSSGYVAYTRADTGRYNKTNVWHFTEFADGAPVSLRLSTRTTTLTGLARPRTIGGQTWLLFGEYRTNSYPSYPSRRFLSIDGGLTWKHVRTIAMANPSVNNHSHTGLIEGSGRIWVSDGDGPNAWFGYSDDRGESWVPVKTPAGSEVSDSGSVFQQPTAMIDFTSDDRISVSPDRGPFSPGLWDMDASTRKTTFNFALPGVYELTPGNGNDAAAQYGHAMYAQDGRTAYVMFSDTGSGSKVTHIAATGDWGRSWWLVASIPWGTGSLSAGIHGPDAEGNIYMQAGLPIPTWTTQLMVAPVLDWDWQMLPSDE